MVPLRLLGVINPGPELHSTHFDNMIVVFVVFIVVFDDLLLLFFLLILLHVAVQEADQEFGVRLNVVHSQVKDVLSILEEKRAALVTELTEDKLKLQIEAFMEMNTQFLPRGADAERVTPHLFILIEARGQNLKSLKMLALTSPSLKVALMKSTCHLGLTTGF